MIYIVFGALGLCFDNLFWSEGQDCVGTRVFRQFPDVCRPPVGILEQDADNPPCSLVTCICIYWSLFGFTCAQHSLFVNSPRVQSVPEWDWLDSGAGWGCTPVVHREIHVHRLQWLSPKHTRGDLRAWKRGAPASFVMSANRTINQLLTPQTCVLVWESPVKATLGGV